MKVFYYFRELDTPMYRWQHTQIFDELARHDINIVPFNPLFYHSKEEANEMALKELKNGKFDLFLTCMESESFYESTLQTIRTLGIPMVLFCPDNLELPYLHKKIVHYFDIVWLTSWETKYLFERWGAKKIVFQSYAANPYIYTPQWGNMISTVGFIGSPYGSRTNKLNILLDGGVSCTVYSNSLFDQSYNTSVGGKYSVDVIDVIKKASRYLRFPIGRKVLYSTIKNKMSKQSKLRMDSIFINKYQSVTDSEMNSLYSNFALSLNITELRDTFCLHTPVHKVHLRAFEIPMAGGLQFANYNEELALYFEDGKEIVFYRSKEEMIDKAKYYLNAKHSTEVLQMKKNARKRAEAEHTWFHRFDKILKSI